MGESDHSPRGGGYTAPSVPSLLPCAMGDEAVFPTASHCCETVHTTGRRTAHNWLSFVLNTDSLANDLDISKLRVNPSSVTNGPEGEQYLCVLQGRFGGSFGEYQCEVKKKLGNNLELSYLLTGIGGERRLGWHPLVLEREKFLTVPDLVDIGIHPGKIGQCLSSCRLLFHSALAGTDAFRKPLCPNSGSVVKRVKLTTKKELLAEAVQNKQINFDTIFALCLKDMNLSTFERPKLEGSLEVCFHHFCKKFYTRKVTGDDFVLSTPEVVVSKIFDDFSGTRNLVVHPANSLLSIRIDLCSELVNSIRETYFAYAADISD